MTSRYGTLCASLAGILSAGSSAVAGVLDQRDEGPLLGGTGIGVITTAVNQSAAGMPNTAVIRSEWRIYCNRHTAKDGR